MKTHLLHLLIPLTFVAMACDKDEPEDTPPTTTQPEEEVITIADATTFKADINGVAVKWVDDDGATAFFNVEEQVLDSVNNQYELTLSVQMNEWVEEGRSSYFEVGPFYVPFDPTAQDYLSVFTPGEYGYNSESDPKMTMGFITIDDTEYRSDWGVGVQNGSKFTIIDSKQVEGENGPEVAFLAELNCNIYGAAGEKLYIANCTIVKHIQMLHVE